MAKNRELTSCLFLHRLQTRGGQDAKVEPLPGGGPRPVVRVLAPQGGQPSQRHQTPRSLHLKGRTSLHHHGVC